MSNYWTLFGGDIIAQNSGLSRFRKCTITVRHRCHEISREIGRYLGLNNFNCRVGNSQHSFPVLSGVRQGCVMSALLFNITIDWVMRQTTQDKNRGIRWNLFTILEDLDFADDLALLSHTYSHIQEKTNRLHIYAKQVGLKINKRKTEVMTLNVQNPAPVKVEEDPLPYTDQLTYLGSTVRHDGGAGSDIINRIGKARNAFRMLSPVWKSQQYKTHTKLKLYKSCVLLAQSLSTKKSASNIRK